MASTSLLLTMPLEVLLSISYYLTTPEYCNLRQSCKHIEASLHSSFAKEYFSKRQFNLTEFSLQVLVDISRSKFSSYLTHVILAAERPVWGGRQHAVGGTVEATRRLRMRQEYASHSSLINFSQDLEMLADAFSNLSNLETIGMRDFNSRTRFRDYPQIEWRSYGANTYHQDTGVALAKPTTSHGAFVHGPPSLAVDNWPCYEARLFTGLLQALGKSGSKPKRFEVILRTIGLFDIAFHVPRFSEPFIDPVLARLDTLFLDLSDDRFPALTVAGDLDQATSNCTNYFLRGFLSKLPALSSLRLNFAMYDHPKACDFLSWLASPSDLTQGTDTDLSPPRPAQLPNLKQLELGKAPISIDVLMDLVNKFQASLQGLSFYKVNLMGTQASESSGRVNLWAKALRHLIKSDVALASLRIDTVYQEHGPSLRTLSIRFKDSSHSAVQSRTWRGRDKETGLKEMANDMVINWPEDDPDDDYSGDESMDELNDGGGDDDDDDDDGDDDDDDNE